MHITLKARSATFVGDHAIWPHHLHWKILFRAAAATGDLGVVARGTDGIGRRAWHIGSGGAAIKDRRPAAESREMLAADSHLARATEDDEANLIAPALSGIRLAAHQANHPEIQILHRMGCRCHKRRISLCAGIMI